MIYDHLGPTVHLLRRAFPEGVPVNDYLPLLAVLQEDMSEDTLSYVVSQLTGLDPIVVGNDAAAVPNIKKPPDDEVQRVRAVLVSAGWIPEMDAS
jgi:hypothetical protein